MSKFSYIMLGLVVTFSSFVLFSVHLGTTDAFVSAQTTLNLDLGKGFPGTSLTDSFTIKFIDTTTTYRITLTPPAEIGVEDMRDDLLVEISDDDKTDPEIDGPISGDPDYTGTGSLTAVTDEQDTWLVTFSAPDETLEPKQVIVYGCQIDIEPYDGEIDIHDGGG
ncbi:MAG: hypothetical protein JW762_15925 [Dehalococcoidales bacterium]|nr:hypothetical protein [Dehalococcoidales bacterium]